MENLHGTTSAQYILSQKFLKSSSDIEPLKTWSEWDVAAFPLKFKAVPVIVKMNSLLDGCNKDEIFLPI